MVRLPIFVVVPLVAELYREFALPLISVDLVPRVGGFGHQFFQDHIGNKRGCPFGPATLKRDRNLFEIPRMGSSSLPAKAVGSSAAAQTLVPCVETAT